MEMVGFIQARMVLAVARSNILLLIGHRGNQGRMERRTVREFKATIKFKGVWMT